MDTSFIISFLIASFIISVYAKNPVEDHIFVFKDEHLTIDCTGHEAEPILKYRTDMEGDPTIFFYGTIRRGGAHEEITARNEGKDYYYDIQKADMTNGGEYECDWTAENDETNHFVNIVDNTTLVCPQFAAPVMAGESVEGLSCQISKSGVVVQSWLNDETKKEALGLDFQIVDSQGNPVAVEYEEKQDLLIAKVVDLKLTKEQNGTALTCKFVSMHKTEVSCQSNAAQVHWKASGLTVGAPDKAEIGKEFEANCDLIGAGNPVNPIVFKVNDVEAESFNVTPTEDQGPAINVSCSVGEIVDTKSVPLYSGPEKIEPSVEKIVANAGDKMVFECTLPVKPYPEAVIAYKIDGTDVASNATAKAEYNGKEITCTASNTVSGHSVTGSIPLEIKFAPMVGKAEATVEEQLESAVVLDCTAEGNPAPTYAWKFTLKDGNSSALETASAKHEIAKLSPDDLGSYECTATNDLGSTVKTFTLNEKVNHNAAIAVSVPYFLFLLLSFLSTTLNIQ